MSEYIMSKEESRKDRDDGHFLKCKVQKSCFKKARVFD